MSAAASELEAALRAQLEALKEALAELRELDAAHADFMKRAEQAHEQTWTSLGYALVPGLGAEDALLRTAQLLRLDALSPAAVRDSLEARRERLSARLDEIEQNGRLAEGPARLQEIAARQPELAEHADALRRSVRELERDADFRRFRDEHAEARWWTFSFYRVQAAGQRALDRHGAKHKADSPESLVKRHTEERAALATLDRELKDLASEQRRLRELLGERERARDTLTRLDEVALDELRALAADSLRGLPEQALLEMCSPLDELRALANAVAGTRAVGRYLGACFTHWVERPRGAVRTRIEDVQLFLGDPYSSGRGVGRTPGEVDAQTRDQRRQAEQNARQYRSAAERLLAFSAWERADPLAGDLWWDHLSGGVIDGAFIDEVAWHRTMRRSPAQNAVGRGLDKRQAWETNAQNAMDALAEVAAQVRAAADETEADESTPAPAPVDFEDE
jgi:hypothetical protein